MLAKLKPPSGSTRPSTSVCMVTPDVAQARFVSTPEALHRAALVPFPKDHFRLLPTSIGRIALRRRHVVSHSKESVQNVNLKRN